MALILLVEDEHLVARTFMRVMHALGYGCAWASDVASALVILREQPVSLIVTDVHLGDENGLDLVERASVDHPAVPVIVMSGRLDERMRAAAHALGAVQCLSKPIDLSSLKCAIEEHLRG